MGKSKRMKKWGGTVDANAVPPGTYDAATIGVVPNAPDPNTSTSTTVNPPSKGIWDTFTSYIPGVGSSSIDDKLKANEAERIRLEQEKAAEKQKRKEKSEECDAALKAIDTEIAALPPAAPQGGGRRRKRSHKKRSRRSKRSRRHL